MLVPDSRGAGPLGLPRMEIMCISGEKCLQTIWDELPLEIKGLQYPNITKDVIWNAARNREMERTLTREELKRVQEGQARETVAQDKFWRMRRDGIVVLPPTETKA